MTRFASVSRANRDCVPARLRCVALEIGFVSRVSSCVVESAVSKGGQREESRLDDALVIVLAAAAAAACTGVVLVGDGHVVGGGNEDNLVTGPAMWATAATPSSYGAVYFGFRFPAMGERLAGWYEMQGVNDRGLYFDLFSRPCRAGAAQTLTSSTATISAYRQHEHLEQTLLTECATVAEALALLRGKNYAGRMPCTQVLVVDRAGNAAVYTGQTDVFRTSPGLVVTNFWLDDPSRGGWPCPRYSTVSSMMTWDASPTVKRAAQMLEAASVVPPPGELGGTQYSVVCDLVAATADVYLKGDFTRRARLDLAPLWALGHERMALSELPFSTSELP